MLTFFAELNCCYQIKEGFNDFFINNLRPHVLNKLVHPFCKKNMFYHNEHDERADYSNL